MKKKVQLEIPQDLIESFSMVCGMPPTCKEIGAILDF